ncbi:hypothetical protein [Pedobacter sp. JCM 36344]|uniref:hypothetical protein n=1 Tax=Pedobacter sp. JCM 36344 TaxID=3374280 RepID=UPI003979BC4E
MENENPYQLFNAQILIDWKQNGITYIKLVELDSELAIKFFELIPNSEIPDSGDTIYHIDSEDVEDLLEPSPNVKFLVHEIYLEEED